MGHISFWLAHLSLYLSPGAPLASGRLLSAQLPTAYTPVGQITSLGGPTVAKLPLSVALVAPRWPSCLSHTSGTCCSKCHLSMFPSGQTTCPSWIHAVGTTALQDCPIARQIGSTAPVIGPKVPVVTSLQQPSGQNHILTLLRKKVPFVILPLLLEINAHMAHSKFSVHPEMKLEHEDENKVST